MEIFMRDVDYSIQQNTLIREIAKILHHNPAFTNLSALPLNFDVTLFRDKRQSHAHRGIGSLTLPTLEIGERFLDLYGEQSQGSLSVTHSRRRIKFTMSKREPRAEVVETIQRLPYLDPVALEQKQQREARYRSDVVRIESMQFGWDCRDGYFSIEWEASLPGITLSFDEDRRELQISFTHEGGQYTISSRFSQMSSISPHHYLRTEPVITISFMSPPTFSRSLLSSTSFSSLLASILEVRSPQRRRLSALPLPGHSRVAPFTSLSLRLICVSPDDLSTFWDLCNTAKLSNVQSFDYPIVRRDLFSGSVEKRLQQWLQTIDWRLAFQVMALVHSFAIDMREALQLRENIMRLVDVEGLSRATLVLRHFGRKAQELFWDDESQTISQHFELISQEFAQNSKAPALPPDPNLFDAYHAYVSPTTITLEGPFPERSNRVVRTWGANHQDAFLRVSFVDEGRLQIRFDREMDGPEFVRSRYGKYLLEGLTIAGRTFDFLAYSQSALKEHSVWFVAPFHNDESEYVDAKTIIKSIGDFKELSFDKNLIYCPARYAARISQAFTATDASIAMEVEEVILIDDVESGKYCFTDGVGTMSLAVAEEIWKALRSRRRTRRIKMTPCAFQIRLMGIKGMISIDHTLTGRVICTRPSMTKFHAPDSRTIEIARAFDKPGRYFLNRPLIMLLEGLGIPYETFKRHQDNAVHNVQKSNQSLASAAQMLESHGLASSFRMVSVMRSLEKLGIDNLNGNEFYHKSLRYAMYHVLRELKNHARIPVPNAWTLVGIADVHDILQPGEIFACIRPVDSNSLIYLEGPVLISRSPTIHPGDVQRVMAIGRPPRGSSFEKQPLANTVVFSVLGDRPLPSFLGGGDLDGDEYNLIPLNDHPEFEPQRTFQPGEYTPAPRRLLKRPAEMSDVAEFIMEYIGSDVLGMIAINWLIIADQKGIEDKDCLTLAQLHSDAVDFPKSGEPVKLNLIPRLPIKAKPDWNAPETVNDSASYYESTRAIGKLFRAVDLPKLAFSAGRRPRRRRGQQRYVVADDIDDLADGMENLGMGGDPAMGAVEDRVFQIFDAMDYVFSDSKIQEVGNIFAEYASELESTCAACTLSHSRFAPLSEEEAIIGTITQKSSQPRKRKDMMAKLREGTDILVRRVREQLLGNEDMPLEESLEQAWVAWNLSEEKQGSFGAKSFGWVALGCMFEVIKDIEEEEKEAMRSRGY